VATVLWRFLFASLSIAVRELAIKQVDLQQFRTIDEADSMSDAGACFSKDVVILSDTNDAHRLEDEIETHLKVNRYSEHEIFSIRLALEEAIVNAIKHGNNFDRNKKIHIRYSVGPDRFDIRISDEGQGFDPDDVPDPTEAENLERACGRGLMLMRYYMNSVCYANNGSCVSMTKFRNGTPDSKQ
jgi:serine/threonine-protein kinase RsbW